MPKPVFNRREFLALTGAGTLAAASHLAGAAATQSPRGFVLSATGCGRATGYAEASKIVTLGDRTHVTWLDAEKDGFRVRIRTLDRRNAAWSPTWTVGAAQDNHGGPALTADSKGFLHILYHPHHRPFRYRKSLRPNDASEWGPEIQFGRELSYPVVLCAPDDSLIVTARRNLRSAGDPKRPWELELWRRPREGMWRREGSVLRSRYPDYAHFQESLAWGPDHRTIHLACRMYETIGVKDEKPLQTIGYLVSPDSGQTWTRADGSPVSLPATPETVDVVIRGGGQSGRELMSGAIAVDARGVPHRLVSVRDGGRARTYLVAGFDKTSGWTKRDLHAFLPARLRDVDLVMPGAITFSASGRATIVATTARLGAVNESDWAHASNEVVCFWSDDGCQTFRCHTLGGGANRRPWWLPNLERATGHHPIPHAPGIIFTGGSGGAGLNELELNNEVWWHTGGD
jgi:hypothetical protein